MICFPFKNCFCKFSRTWGNNYIPKDATQQDTFLSKYPHCDGRGIKIAIIDSGFDVSLDGLQRTSEGLPKVIDCFDFTGNGDVDTSVIKEVDSKSFLIGLSGKKLKIPLKWKNPSGKWHLGLKSLFKPTMLKTESDIAKKLPELDCLVWFDGTKWCACIETFKDLKNAKVLTNFRDEHEYGILHLKGLKMTYCITLRENGNLLEIFMPCDHHGSVVSQIAATHFPKHSENDGLAPGAQVVFMCIMAPTDQYALNIRAAKKAFLKCIEMKVDIINYSVSSAYWDDEITNLMSEMINLHNILFFKCAGNNGPFYGTTEKTDKNVEHLIFTIGAMLTSEIRKRIYTGRIDDDEDECSSDVLYPFSSRGPGAMTSQGLHFVAPGGAIAKIPKFAQEKYNGFAGTSYSSPNAAGAVVCLLSGLKANGIQYTPKSIKFVLTKTAKLPENQNKFEFGNGIIQINNAFDFYCNHKNVDFNSKIPPPIPAAGGIYFIQDDEDNEIMEREIDLSKFIEIKPGEAIAKKWTLEVSPETAKAFLELLTEIDENNKFSIKDPLIGSIYNIPVNFVYLLKTTETHNSHFQKEIILIYENPYHLIFVPCFESSKICEIKITAMETTATILNVQYLIQSNTVVPEDNLKALHFTPKNQTEIYSMPIVNKVIYEICFYQAVGASANAKFTLAFDFKDDPKEEINTMQNEMTIQ